MVERLPALNETFESGVQQVAREERAKMVLILLRVSIVVGMLTLATAPFLSMLVSRI